MRLLFGLSVVFFARFFGFALGAACAGDPVDSPGNLSRVREAVLSGNTSSAVNELRSLPSQQRLEWLSLLHQQGGGENPNGGGAMADYSSLIGLIENVIEADWQSNGGSATLYPYRQGVRIDPHGLIERFEPSNVKLTELKFDRDQKKAAKPDATELAELGDWQEASSLRWVSLHQLDQQLIASLNDSKSSRANIAMELLGGLYRIDYLAYDKASREWYLGGPAGKLVINASKELVNSETGLPPVLLEDLLGIAPHILRNKGEFGCSIDPDPARLTEAYEMARTSSSMRAMQRQPEKWAEQWRQKLGRQNAKVIGLRQDSPTGYALLIADAHMKRLGLGLEPCPAQMKSYWQEKEALSSISNPSDSSMVRWWFSLTDHKIPMDPDRQIYHFTSSNVQVLSEAQMMNAKGERVAKNSPDLAADSFARKFTRNFDRLQREYPVYGRLRHIFDLAVALEIVRHEIRNGNGKPFLAIDHEETQPRLPVAPTELESVAATHRLPSGSMSAMISGGVSIQISDAISRLKVDKLEINKVALESSNDASKNADAIASSKNDSQQTLRPQRDLPFWR